METGTGTGCGTRDWCRTWDGGVRGMGCSTWVRCTTTLQELPIGQLCRAWALRAQLLLERALYTHEHHGLPRPRKEHQNTMHRRHNLLQSHPHLLITNGKSRVTLEIRSRYFW